MDNFSIALDPSITAEKFFSPSKEEITAFGLGTIWNLTAHLECNLTYTVANEKFAYWPTPLPSVFADLMEELKHLSVGTSHDMTICGYTVLAVEYLDEMAFFYDLSDGDKRRIGRGCSRSQVDAEIRRAVNLVWTKIRTFL